MRQDAMMHAQGMPNLESTDADNESKLVDRLNDLIAANKGIVEVYRSAMERLKDETNTRLLQSYLDKHADFAADLTKVVAEYGGEPADSDGLANVVKRVWVTLKAAVTQGDGPILEEVAQDATTLLDAYGDAMSLELPDGVRAIIREQMSEARLIAKKVSALGTAYNK